LILLIWGSIFVGPRRARRCARTDAGGAVGREPLDCRRGGERRRDQAGRSTAKREALDAVPSRCASTDAGGAIGREALDAARWRETCCPNRPLT